MDSPLLFFLLVALCIGSALTTLVSFVMYIRTRVAERDHPDEAGPDEHRRQAALERKERLYQSIHFLSLLAFVVLGVLILVIIARRID
jgi:NADH:ubiquinone oxidoreductase subunit 3 (subunit A)